MNHFERMKNTIAAKPTDYPPSIFIATSVVCELLGIKQNRWATNAQILADSLIRFTEMCGCDGIYVTRDNLITHQAMGGKLFFPENDEPFAAAPVLQSLTDFKKLTVPDPFVAPGMKTVIAAAQMVKEKVGENYYVMANIDCGPFGTAANLRGVENFLIDIADRAAVHQFLEFCTELVIAYGKAIQQTGVHGIQFGDSAASLINAKQFKEFVLPYEAKAFAALANAQCDLWLHICGQTQHILPMLHDLNIHVFEVDTIVPLKRARQLLGNRIALKGNLDTIFLQNAKPEDVFEKTKEMINEYDAPGGLIVSAGCGVPRHTPLENLRAMTRACWQD